MKFVVASSSEGKLEEAFRLLGGCPQVEIRHGPVPEVSAGCDGGVLHYTIAHDRYGGMPTIGKAQVLKNQRNDGVPPVILATPPLESGAGMGPDVQAEVERHAMRVLSMALAEWVRSPLYPHGSSEAVCLIHIEGAGLDFGDFGAIARGIRRAIEGSFGQPE